MQDWKKKAVDKAVSQFDFVKAAKALAGCGWRFNGNSESPTAEELKIIARKICEEVIELGRGGEIKHGPINVRIDAHHDDTPEVKTLRLALIPVFSHAVYVDDLTV